MDLGLDPVHGKGHQTYTAIGVKALDGLHQAHVTFLNQVGMRQAVTQVLAGNGDHQPQVRQNQFTRSIQVILVAQALTQLGFAFGAEHGQAVNSRNIRFDRPQCAWIRHGGDEFITRRQGQSVRLLCHGKSFKSQPARALNKALKPQKTYFNNH